MCAGSTCAVRSAPCAHHERGTREATKTHRIESTLANTDQGITEIVDDRNGDERVLPKDESSAGLH